MMLKNGKSVRVGLVVATLAAASLQVALAGASSSGGRSGKLTRSGSAGDPPRVVRHVLRGHSVEEMRVSGNGDCVMRVLPTHPTFDLSCSQAPNDDSSSSPQAPGSLVTATPVD